jgi:predicted metal-binding protein
MSTKSLPFVKEPAFKKTSQEIQEDLKLLEQKALELGADGATIITADKIVVDERATLKCKKPPCYGYRRNLTCPPYAMKPEETRQLIKKYKYALLIKREPNPQDVMYSPEKLMQATEKPLKEMEKIWKEEHEMHGMISQLEGYAFHLGYYLAIAFKPGPCYICGYIKASEKGDPINLENVCTCPGLKEGRCIYDFKVKDAMEAAGIDVYATVSNAGWPIYVIGMQTDPSAVTRVGFYALLLVY